MTKFDRNGVWSSHTGLIKYCDMEDSHIANILDMLNRTYYYTVNETFMKDLTNYAINERGLTYKYLKGAPYDYTHNGQEFTHLKDYPNIIINKTQNRAFQLY